MFAPIRSGGYFPLAVIPAKPGQRPGMSLIELLVVIGIIAMLVGLLLPAVQQTRQAAMRISCTNKMRQIGLGLHAFHDTALSFPPGMQDNYEQPYPLLSWMGRILPYVEQEALWAITEAAYRSDPLLSSNPPHVGESTLVPLYQCPACSVPFLLLHQEDVWIALGSYRGVAGTTMFSGDGVLYRDSAVRLAEILDGTSNTLLVSESAPLADNEAPVGPWYDGVGLTQGAILYGSPDVVLGVREINIAAGEDGNLGRCPSGPYAFGPGTAGAPCDVFHFWSQHGNGANFLMADGSVHFFKYDANTVLPALATRAGGEVAALPF